MELHLFQCKKLFDGIVIGKLRTTFVILIGEHHKNFKYFDDAWFLVSVFHKAIHSQPDEKNKRLSLYWQLAGIMPNFVATGNPQTLWKKQRKNIRQLVK